MPVTRLVFDGSSRFVKDAFQLGGLYVFNENSYALLPENEKIFSRDTLCIDESKWWIERHPNQIKSFLMGEQYDHGDKCEKHALPFARML